MNSTAQQNRNVYQDTFNANCAGSSTLKIIPTNHHIAVYPTASIKYNMLFKWFINSSIKIPTSIKSFSQTNFTNLFLFSPICYAKRFVLVCKHSVAPLVARLLKNCSPSTILFAIVSVNVNTVYGRISTFFVNTGMFQIRFIHVIFEFFKRLPKVLNASPAVQIIFRVFRVATPLFNFVKSSIELRSIKTMHLISLLYSLDVQTPTGLRIASLKIPTYYRNCIATLTNTVPLTMQKGFVYSGQYSKSSKLFSY